MFGDIALIVVLSLCALIVWRVLRWTLRKPPGASEGLVVLSTATFPPRNVRVLDPKDEKFAEMLARARRDLYDREGELTSPSDAMDWIKDLRGKLEATDG